MTLNHRLAAIVLESTRCNFKLEEAIEPTALVSVPCVLRCVKTDEFLNEFVPE